MSFFLGIFSGVGIVYFIGLFLFCRYWLKYIYNNNIKLSSEEFQLLIPMFLFWFIYGPEIKIIMNNAEVSKEGV